MLFKVMDPDTNYLKAHIPAASDNEQTRPGITVSNDSATNVAKSTMKTRTGIRWKNYIRIFGQATECLTTPIRTV